MPSEPGVSGISARMARPALVSLRRAGDALAAPGLHHQLAERLLVEADPHHEHLALQPDQRAGERQRAAPLAGAGLGGQPLDAELLVVPGLRDGRVGLVAAGRADALVLVVDPRRRAEVLLQPAGAVQRARPPQRQQAEDLLGDVDPPLGGDFLLDEVHREHRGEHVRADGLAVRPQRGLERRGQVGRQVVPLPRHLVFGQQNLRLFHAMFLLQKGCVVSTQPPAPMGQRETFPGRHVRPMCFGRLRRRTCLKMPAHHGTRRACGRQSCRKQATILRETPGFGKDD